MGPDELKGILLEASRQICEKPDRCGHLVYSPRSDRPHVREPEAMIVLTTVLAERGIDFSIERPTIGKYVISALTPDRANIDIVVEPGEHQINVELKEGQVAATSIGKDFMKFTGESSDGAVFFHTLQDANRGTLPSLLGKYASAYSGTTLGDQLSKWFMLFILVRNQKKCYSSYFEHMTCISDMSFDLSLFSAVSL